MKTLIIYASKHLSTKSHAQAIAAQLPGATIYPVETAPSPKDYDQVILGTAIYAGAALPDMQTYCQTHQTELLQKQLHLFICCINPNATIISKQLHRAFPDNLRQHALQAASLGGTINFGLLTRKEKALMRVLGYTDSYSNFDASKLRQFIANIPTIKT